MLTKTITYTDYNGVQRTEKFYFNLTQAEVAEMEMTTEGGLVEKLQRIIDAQDSPKIIAEFKDLVLRSYGEKSDDGRRFIKNRAIQEAFSQTEAYSQIFMELAFNTEAAIDFVNGIIPDVAKAPMPVPQ